MNKLIIISIIVLSLGASSIAAVPAVGDRSPRVTADPRVELLGIIFRLAGNPEYNQGRVKSYDKDVERHFARYKNHAAVKMARKLRRTRGISYDAVMSLAIHLTDAESLQEKVLFHPRPKELDTRWRITEAREFLYAARKFVKETGFNGFIKNRKPLYDTAVSRLKKALEKGRTGWLDAFFGGRPNASLIVVPALLHGGQSYGVRIKTAKGGEELYCIMGAWLIDKKGLPFYNDSVLPWVIHEFCHSYANPLVDKHRRRLRKAGQRIFPYVEDIMKRQAYIDWKIMLYESLVRGCVVRYVETVMGPAAAKKRMADDVNKGFPWMEEFSTLLGEYERSRKKYPNLDAFFAKIVSFFDKYADIMEKTPRVISMIPANGAKNVDPGLQTITIRFSRVMRDRSWSVTGGGPGFPQITGQPVYHSNRTILIIPVKLKPGWTYEFGLNSTTHHGFASEESIPLSPVRVRFSTRSK